ncbi:MAG: ABC transporter ATP-binding protein [Fidelibacterota bacterium]
MIKFDNVTKVFHHAGGDRVVALNTVSVDIAEKEFVTVIGTNGSGKSTFLNTLSGHYLCDAGEIILDGQRVTRLPEHKRAKLIGRVFQDPFTGTAPNLTIAENLRIAQLRGMPRGLKLGLTKRNKDFFVTELKKLEMGLEDRLEATVGLLSGGQRQALTMLMATLRNPKILLLDEHTAALDPKAAEQILRLTRKIVAENQLTTVMVTHSMNQALELGTRTLMMHKGQCVGDYTGYEREKLKAIDLLNKFNELRKEELFDEVMLNRLQREYY